MVPSTKVYEVKVPFTHEGLSYEAGQKYELAEDIVVNLAAGTVEEYLIVPEVPPVVETNVAQTTPEAQPLAAETQPAQPWVGSHTVGRN